MSRAPRIWVVDDDPELRNLLQEYLTQQGFEVRVLPDAIDLEARLMRERPDLLVLDLMLPDIDGLEVCRRLRAAHDDIPIIMLTAKSAPNERVIGIESGADDYIGKPFLPRELTVRIQAVLRRRSSLPTGRTVPGGDTVSFGSCRIDLVTRSLWRDDSRLEITTAEFALLYALIKHPHLPLSRARLIELARGPNSEAVGRSVDVQISRLRRLIEVDPANPVHIQTVWGFGYVFVPESGEPGA